MLPKDPQLAPASEIVRYLAIFQRALAAIVEYTRKDDIHGMLLAGWLTDALHNVPGLLWKYSDEGFHTPARVDAWMGMFPDSVREREAPHRLVEDCKRIVSAGGGARELGVREDLTDLDLAPLEKMYLHLDRLYHACLVMRYMRNYGRRPSRVQETIENVRDVFHFATTGKLPTVLRKYTPWEELEQIWTQAAQAQAVFNAQMAQALLPVPRGLVHWEQFDEAAFHREAASAVSTIPEGWQASWIAFFDSGAA